MLNARIFTYGIAGLMAMVGIALVIERGGLIAWFGLLCGALLLFKAWRKPGKHDLTFTVGVLLSCTVAWVVTHNYVISTWESGEVIT